MGQFGVTFQLYIMSFLLPSVQCEFRMSIREEGFLASISYIGAILGSYMWGLLADTRGRKKPLTISLMLDSVCGLLSSLAPDFYSFLALRFLSGFFICCAGAVMFPYVGEFFNSRNRPTAIMALITFMPIGLLTLTGLAWLVIPQSWSVQLPWCNYNSWRILVAICSVPSAVGGLLTAWVLPESPKYLMVCGEMEGTLKVLRRMYAMNTGNEEVDYKVQCIDPGDENVENTSRKSFKEQLKDVWFEQTLPLFKKPYVPRTLLFLVYQFGIFASFNALALWLPDIFNNMASFFSAKGRSETICKSMEFVTLTLHKQTTNQTTVLDRQNSSELLSFWFYNVSSVGETASLENNSTSAINTEQLKNIGADACEVIIYPETFVNSLIIYAAMSLIATASSIALKWFRPKPIIMLYLSVSFTCAVALNFVQDDSVVLLLACFYLCTCAISGSLMVTAAVDLFPTNLRGMAVCLGMMMARTGVVVGSQTIAALLEYSCPAVFYIQAGMTLACGTLAFLLPNRTKT